MKTKWDSLIQKLDYECSELMRELKVHEEARNRSILSLRTLNNEIQEIVDNLASGQSRVAHEVQIAWSFLERLEALKSQCFTDIESTTNSLERIGVQMDLKIKEKKKYEKLAEFAVAQADILQVRKEDDEAEETVVIRWRPI
jgi:chromosome segregation ATPase|tara:strand:+ start:76 stop:501 length:426 start_codon:yes stop_codon:yes gene_type:complete